MRSRFNFEIKIVGIMLIILVLVSVMGFFAYSRFSDIVRNISEETRPDLRLLTAKSLVNDIAAAENSVKSFTLTKDTNYLNKFYAAAGNADLKMTTLLELSQSEKPFEISLDTLDSLISGKFNILRELLVVQDEFRVQQALDKVVMQIKTASNGESQPGELKRTKKSKVNPDPVTVEKPTKPERKGFLSRLFGKSRKNDENNESQEEDALAMALEDEQDSADDDRITISDVNKEVQVIKREERSIESAIKARELSLIVADKAISDRIRELLDEFEAAEMIYIAQETADADAAVRTTNQQIALFCLATGILLLFMAYVIINYVRNNRRYRLALRNAKMEAENLAATKEKFLANMSHEIRTPMNAISGFAEQLDESNLTESQKDQLTMIRKSTEHLQYLVNDVLDYTKLQAGRLTLEEMGFRPQEVIHDVVRFVKILAAEKPLKIDSNIDDEVPEVLIGDPFRLRQILINLVSNAVKFTDKGSVHVAATTVMNAGESTRLRLTVRDTGIGMQADQREKIFREFEQGDTSTARIYGGTGLGLSITKMLVELHDGSIEIVSEFQKGTSVNIELPFKIGKQTDVTIHTEQDIKKNLLHGVRVLVVDDEPYNRKLLTTILKKHHAVFTEAGDGQEALDELTKNSYDVVLMDVRMPVLNGVEATREIRKMRNKSRRYIPVIALTAAVSEEERQNYKDAGMDGFQSKPFSEAALLKELERVIDSQAKNINQKVMNAGSATSNGTEPEVNFEQLADISSGDMVFYREMLETLISSTTEGIKDIDEAVAELHWERLAEISHKLRSPIGHIGAKSLWQKLKELEKTGREIQDEEKAKKLIGQIQDEWTVLSKVIRKELESIRFKDA